MNNMNNNIHRTFEFNKLILFIITLLILKKIYTINPNYINDINKFTLFYILCSFLILVIDKFKGPLNIFITKKESIDFKKIIFIMLYISLFYIYHPDGEIREKIKNINYCFKIIFVIIFMSQIIIGKFEIENSKLLIFEYLFYHWIIFGIIVLLIYLIVKNDNINKIIKLYLKILFLISIIIILIKPFIDILVGYNKWKYSNYILINHENSSLKNNKIIINNFMNYIIINIIFILICIFISVLKIF